MQMGTEIGVQHTLINTQLVVTISTIVTAKNVDFKFE